MGILLQIPDYRNAVMVARHPGAVKRATSYAERLRLSIAVIHGEEKVAESDRDDGRYSPPPPDVETRRNVSEGLQLLPSETFMYLLLFTTEGSSLLIFKR